MVAVNFWKRAIKVKPPCFCDFDIKIICISKLRKKSIERIAKVYDIWKKWNESSSFENWDVRADQLQWAILSGKSYNSARTENSPPINTFDCTPWLTILGKPPAPKFLHCFFQSLTFVRKNDCTMRRNISYLSF